MSNICVMNSTRKLVKMFLQLHLGGGGGGGCKRGKYVSGTKREKTTQTFQLLEIAGRTHHYHLFLHIALVFAQK